MPSAVASPDHRPRIAAERRAGIRARLIETALIVYARKGIGASVVPDVVAAAEVSQGSFYDYFRSNEDLLAAVSEALSNEMLLLVEAVVGGIEDPALRVATGIRCYLRLARTYRVAARFLYIAGLAVAGKKSAVYEFLPPDLREGRKRGYFDAASPDVAMDMIRGAAIAAIHRMANGRTVRDYPEYIVMAILRSLGMDTAVAERLTSLPLPRLTVPPESLLVKTQARFAMPETASD